MSYSDDLDWLARNVHTWPKCIIDGEHRETLLWIEPSKGDVKTAFSSNPLHCFSRDQWLARRAELQNKPTEWPDGANWLAQDRDGEWSFYTDSADNPPQNHGEANWYSDDDVIRVRRIGEVLGDWRDTLERRPDMHKTTPEIDTSAERVQEAEEHVSEDIEDVLELAFWEFDAARSKSSEERLCFKNKVRWLLANYGARGEPEHDDDWHERGVLPPAGIRCEAEFGGVWELVYVVGRDSFDRLVIECADGDLIPVEATNFRPIRTEREEMIDNIIDMLNVGGPYHEIAERICDGILAAGFKREGGAS